jgi:hypothetical protein
VEEVANSLYTNKNYENEQYLCRLFVLGLERNQNLSKEVVQITWREILEFIYQRFIDYGRYKTQHQQWDCTGKLLFNKVVDYGQDQEAFIQDIIGGLHA